MGFAIGAGVLILLLVVAYLVLATVMSMAGVFWGVLLAIWIGAVFVVPAGITALVYIGIYLSEEWI